MSVEQLYRLNSIKAAAIGQPLWQISEVRVGIAEEHTAQCCHLMNRANQIASKLSTVADQIQVLPLRWSCLMSTGVQLPIVSEFEAGVTHA